MVKADLEVCPNCSHPFVPEDPTVEKERDSTRSVIGRPFRFMALSLLSFIAVLTFMNAEGVALSGSIPLDIVGLILISLLIAGILSYIDYRIDD